MTTNQQTLHIHLYNVQQELEHIEQKIKNINSELCIEKIQKQNDYMLSELNNMLEEYNARTTEDAQKICSKIKRILYKVGELRDKDVQHGERPRAE